MDLARLADLSPLLLLVFGLLAASAFFSGSEVAMFSLRRVDRERLARSDKPRDKLVLRMLAKPRVLIATLLIGNELVNVTMSATMASISEEVLVGYSEVAVAVLATFCVLPLLLLLGEITPKTVAFKAANGWVATAARPLWVFWRVATPLRWVVRLIAEAMMRPLGVDNRPPEPRAMGEEEFIALLEAGGAEGQVNARERRLIRKVFEFGDKTVAQVMVPAEDAFLLAYNMPLSQILREVSARGLSRVPIYHRTRDNILGILYAKDLVLPGTGLTAGRRLGELLHEPLFVPRTMRIERLFEMFKRRKIHMAIVVNEYGKLFGLITMEDLLEELFGPIRDEKEVRARRRMSRSDSVPGLEEAAQSASDEGEVP